VVLAGQAGVLGHVTIGDRARIAAQSGVLKSVEGNKDYTGMPARPRMQQLRAQAATGRLPELLERVRTLEARLAALEDE